MDENNNADVAATYIGGQISARAATDSPAGENEEHRHFGYWINRELRTARCYECGFQFAADDDTAEEWDGSGEWGGDSRLDTELMPADQGGVGDDSIRVTLGNGAEIVVATWRGSDGVPVVQIDTDATLRTGRVRINLNDAPVWDGDPESDQALDEQGPAVGTGGARGRRTRGVLAPLTITRDDAGFVRWWTQAPNREDIIEILGTLAATDCDDAEYGLHRLMLAVFQDPIDAAQWLRVTGLRRGVVPRYLCLDIDPAHDGEGILDGVEVVLSLHSGPPFVPLKVSVYINHPRRVLVPESMDDPQAALAELIDTALYIVNADIADQDRFIFEARDVLAC